MPDPSYHHRTTIDAPSMTSTRSNTQSTTRSGLIHASGLPSLRAGRKRATSAVDEAANKKPKPAPEIEQEVSEEESEEEEKKVGKKNGLRPQGQSHLGCDERFGRSTRFCPVFCRQTGKPGANKAAKGKGGKWGASSTRRTAAEKELEEAAAVIPAHLPRTEQALLDSGISVAPPKRTRTAATTSAGPTAPTSSANTRQRRADAPIEENDPRDHEG
ncbi:hypothetical protein DXG01_014380, partial [Tephrocybe rancida]